ncbi:hypothetical protein GCM10009664_59970 [Kitasatospora gansuensis]
MAKACWAGRTTESPSVAEHDFLLTDSSDCVISARAFNSLGADADAEAPALSDMVTAQNSVIAAWDRAL